MTVKIARRLLKSIVIAFVCWAVGCSGAAFAECQRQPRSPLQGALCSVDGAHVRVWWNPAFGTDEQKATAIQDDVESRLWPLFEKFFGRVPLSDGDRALYSERNGGDGRYDIVLVRLGPSQHGQSPLVTKRVTTAPPARFSMLNLYADGDAAARKGRPRPDTRISLRVQMCCALPLARRSDRHLGGAFRGTKSQHGARVCERFLSGSFSVAHPRSDRQGSPQIRAYLFLFFLQHHGTSAPGGRPEIVRAIWEETERSPDAASALNAIPDGLSEGWREFMNTTGTRIPPSSAGLGRRFLFTWPGIGCAMGSRAAGRQRYPVSLAPHRNTTSRFRHPELSRFP